MTDNNNSPEHIDGDLFDINNFELFYCRPDELDIEGNKPLIEYPIHHKHFRILSRIILVKIGMYENIEKLELLPDSKPDLDDPDFLDYPSESIDMTQLESWESKILFYSSKLFFNELSNKEVEELQLDFDLIRISCRYIWESNVSYYYKDPDFLIISDLSHSELKSIWNRKIRIIKKKHKIWKRSWVKVFYHKEKQTFFQKFHGFNWDYTECVGLNRELYRRSTR